MQLVDLLLVDLILVDLCKLWASVTCGSMYPVELCYCTCLSGCPSRCPSVLAGKTFNIGHCFANLPGNSVISARAKTPLGFTT